MKVSVYVNNAVLSNLLQFNVTPRVFIPLIQLYDSIEPAHVTVTLHLCYAHTDI